MPRPALRTRSRKRVSKALPGGRRSVHFKREIPGRATCSICGNPLAGTPRLLPSEVGKLNRSKRRVSRIYGGQLCSNCLKKALKQAVRAAIAPGWAK
ncbi:MAG: 50S ribosomal protein L34e [Candidatus Bathyarchaeota archaeon]|nr:50S ribosomal protein L34e [Candidatus Bathyarchaeota archaeon]